MRLSYNSETGKFTPSDDFYIESEDTEDVLSSSWIPEYFTVEGMEIAGERRDLIRAVEWIFKNIPGRKADYAHRHYERSKKRGIERRVSMFWGCRP